MSSKEIYGEIFTPFVLVDKMLNFLPSDVWTNSALTWLDPGCGPGVFSIAIYLRLFKLNYNSRHIIQNQLHMVEINPKHIWLIRDIFRNKPNIYEADFLSWKSDKLFDIIIGNPPYNRHGLIKPPTSSLDKQKDGKAIWRDFIKKSLQLLKPNGYLCFIVPSIWMKPDREGIYNLLTQYKIHYIECFSNTETNKLFKGEAQTPTCCFLLQKKPTDQSILLWDKAFNHWEQYSLYPNIAIPVYGVTILKKFLSHKNKFNQLNIIKTSMPPKTLKLSDNNSLPFKGVYTCRLDNLTPKLIIKFSNKEQPYYKKKKIIMAHGMWGFPYIDYDGELGICNRDKYLILRENNKELEQLAKFFSTKTARYLFQATRYRMKLLERYIFDLIPDITKLDKFPEEITDSSIAKYFELTESEQEIIEISNKKEYRVKIE